MHTVGDYIADLQDTLGRIPQNSIEQVLQTLTAAFHRGNRIYFVGNGGSAATASHFVCDLTKNTGHANGRRFREERIVIDMNYLAQRSLRMDLTILIQTIVVVLLNRIGQV